MEPEQGLYVFDQKMEAKTGSQIDQNGTRAELRITHIERETHTHTEAHTLNTIITGQGSYIDHTETIIELVHIYIDHNGTVFVLKICLSCCGLFGPYRNLRLMLKSLKDYDTNIS